MIDSGDTAWMVTSSALVLLMTPGLAFFYGGLVRRKNVLSVFMQCLTAVCVVGLQWVLVGYSLAFGPDHGGLIGGLSYVGLHNVGLDPEPRLCGDDPPPTVRGLPDDVRGYHTGAYHRGFCRADEVQRLSRLFDPVGHHRLRPAGALDVGRGRVSQGVWGARLRRWHGRSHQRRHGGLGSGSGVGQTPGIPRHRHSSQPCLCRAGGRSPLVRLVRVQRRQRPQFRRSLRARLRQHAVRRDGRCAGLGRPRLDRGEKAHHPGVALRSDRRAGGRDSGIRFRRSTGRPWHRSHRRCPLLRQRHDRESRAAVRRLPRRFRDPRSRGSLGRVRRGTVGQPSGQRERGGWGVPFEARASCWCNS